MKYCFYGHQALLVSISCAKNFRLDIYGFRTILKVDTPRLQVMLDLFDDHLHLRLALKIFHCYLFSVMVKYVSAALTRGCSQDNLLMENEKKSMF